MFNTFDLSTINYLAVLLATAGYFFLGFLWFSKLMFAQAWMNSLNMNPENMDKSNLGKIMVFTFIVTVIICFSMHVLINLIGIASISAAVKLGLLTGIGFIFSTQFINSQYENRSNRLLLINSGYHVCGFIIAAIIIVACR